MVYGVVVFLSIRHLSEFTKMVKRKITQTASCCRDFTVCSIYDNFIHKLQAQAACNFSLFLEREGLLKAVTYTVKEMVQDRLYYYRPLRKM